MSADTTSPSRDGVGVVGDRYRLVERVWWDDRTVFWRAHDELLARPVALTVHTPGGEAAQDFLAQAHRLSTVTHAAVTRVYDAVDEEHRAYVVSEWVDGTPLSQMLAEEPLEPNEAAALVGRVAEGVSQAHALGVAFGGLHPDHIYLSRRGMVFSRIASGRATTADDIRGLGALLYATLTGQWPLPTDGRSAPGGLRPAHNINGQLSSPRQVRAAVPHDLSALAMRALQPEDPRGLRSAEAVVTVLGERAAPMQYDSAPYESPASYADSNAATQYQQPYQQQYEQPARYNDREPRRPERPPAYERPGRYDQPYERDYDQQQYPRRRTHDQDPDRRRSHRATVITLSAGVLALALVAWLIGSLLRQVPDEGGGKADKLIDMSKTPGSPTGENGQTTQAPSGAAVTPTSVQLFDPEPGGDGTDNPSKVPLAIDGDPSTDWSTVDYKRNAAFGGLKSGMGLIIDLGKPTAVRQVTITTTTPTAEMEIRAGDQASGGADSYTVVGQVSSSGTTRVIDIPESAGTHQYWVVWITKLAPADGGMFNASIAEVKFTA